MKSWKGVLGLVSLLLVSVAYGEGRGGKKVVEPDSAGDSYQPRTPEQARSKLSERGIQYTQSSFFERVEKGDLFAVQLFVDAGMTIHARTNQGKTALMVAAASLTRSFREAQTYTSIAMIAPTLPVVFAALRPMQDSVPLMLVPALSQHLLLSDVLRAEALDPLHIVTSVASTTVVTAALVWLTVRRFRSEKLIL